MASRGFAVTAHGQFGPVSGADRHLAMQEPSGPRAGQRRGHQRGVPVARRAGAWLVWWVLLMSFWVILDDSIALDELLAGAGAAALAAFLAELVSHQAGTRFRMRVEWLVPALGLPGQVVAGHGDRLRGPVAAAVPRRAAAQRIPGDPGPFRRRRTPRASPGGCC